jgi:hypothetical protein
MRNRLALLPAFATAGLNAASIGVVIGVLGCVHAGNLDFGIRAAGAGFMTSAVLLVYLGWRTHRPPRQAFLDKHYR